MASELPPPNGPDVNRGPEVIAVTVVECVLAVVIVACRFYSRISIKQLGADDWTMLASLVSLPAEQDLLTRASILL